MICKIGWKAVAAVVLITAIAAVYVTLLIAESGPEAGVTEHPAVSASTASARPQTAVPMPADESAPPVCERLRRDTDGTVECLVPRAEAAPPVGRRGQS